MFEFGDEVIIDCGRRVGDLGIGVCRDGDIDGVNKFVIGGIDPGRSGDRDIDIAGSGSSGIGGVVVAVAASRILGPLVVPLGTAVRLSFAASVKSSASVLVLVIVVILERLGRMVDGTRGNDGARRIDMVSGGWSLPVQGPDDHLQGIRGHLYDVGIVVDRGLAVPGLIVVVRIFS